MEKKQITILVSLVAIFILFKSATFRVNEWQQAVVMQFGKIIGEPKVKAGLEFKVPFLQSVRYFDRRILTWDGETERVPTKDKKYIQVDTTARWRIVDPVRYLETVQNERRATRRITSIIDGKTKNIVSNYNLVETVRNTNKILEKATELKGTEEEITNIETITLGREKLSRIIGESARGEIETLGIELIDVLIRRIAYEKSVEKKVYDRMVSERNRIAERIRSIGKGEEAKIRGTLNLDLKTIESEAYRKAKLIKGMADSKAIKIYADAVKKDPKYYDFIQTLDAYKASLPGRTNFILGTDSHFLKIFDSGGTK